jgi:hypothetical protein
MNPCVTPFDILNCLAGYSNEIADITNARSGGEHFLYPLDFSGCHRCPSAILPTRVTASLNLVIYVVLLGTPLKISNLVVSAVIVFVAYVIPTSRWLWQKRTGY